MGVGVYLIVRRIAEPILAISEAIKIAAGDLNQTAPVRTDDEIGVLAGNFDSFVERPVRDGPWSARVSGREAPRAVGC